MVWYLIYFLSLFGLVWGIYGFLVETKKLGATIFLCGAGISFIIMMFVLLM